MESVSGLLDHFLVEPFVPHKPTDEYYIAIIANRDGDEILFYHQGGVDVGDVDAKALVRSFRSRSLTPPRLDTKPVFFCSVQSAAARARIWQVDSGADHSIFAERGAGCARCSISEVRFDALRMLRCPAFLVSGNQPTRFVEYCCRLP